MRVHGLIFTRTLSRLRTHPVLAGLSLVGGLAFFGSLLNIIGVGGWIAGNLAWWLGPQWLIIIVDHPILKLMGLALAGWALLRIGSISLREEAAASERQAALSKLSNEARQGQEAALLNQVEKRIKDAMRLPHLYAAMHLGEARLLTLRNRYQEVTEVLDFYRTWHRDVLDGKYGVGRLDEPRPHRARSFNLRVGTWLGDLGDAQAAHRGDHGRITKLVDPAPDKVAEPFDHTRNPAFMAQLTANIIELSAILKAFEHAERAATVPVSEAQAFISNEIRRLNKDQYQHP